MRNNKYIVKIEVYSRKKQKYSHTQKKKKKRTEKHTQNSIPKHLRQILLRSSYDLSSRALGN